MGAGRACAALVALLAARVAGAGCPPDCVGGGHDPATDCLVEFGGITSTDDSCTDGNPSCDADAIVNGACTFPLSVCLNVPGDPRCSARLSASPVVGPVRSEIASTLGQAVAALDPSRLGCTTPGVAVAVGASLRGIAPATARLVITGRSASRRDRNRIRLTCRPAPTPPSLAGVIAPIFEARCALPACHAAGPGSVAPVLAAASEMHAALVDVPAANVPSLMLVRPGSVADSYLARKILGKRITDRTPRMPQGCPRTVPAGGCLTDAEIAAILAWIQTGAPDN